MNEVSRINTKIERGLTFTFTLDLSSPILLTRAKLTRQWKSILTSAIANITGAL